MTEQEKKIVEELAGKEVQIPENLLPENIEKKLKEQQKKGKKTMWWKNKKICGSLAAAAALVVGLGVFSLQSQDGKLSTLADQQEEGATDSQNQIAVAESYEQVYEHIEEYQRELEKTNSSGISLFAVTEDTAMESAAADVSVSKTSGTVSNSSDTNVRTEGVGEADIVKTNGKYIFTLQENAMEMCIIDATTDRMTELARIKSENGAQISEFYVKDDQVFLFTNVSKSQIDEKGYEVYIGTATCLETYDISNIKEPKKVASTEQSGFYNSSRIVGDYIYTFSHHEVYANNNKDKAEEYIPHVNAEVIAAEHILLPEQGACQYVVVTSVNVNEPEKIVDHKAILTDYGTCYVSSENIYIYETARRVSVLRDIGGESSQTDIRKISYKDGILSGVAKGTVEGWINDSFSIDEYEGNLRIVTTVEGKDTTTNSVYVLDENLEKIGEINGIAKDERIYSARLFGDIGYFVTYRETDPLFTVDFSEPTNPQIIGKLKIPGFSEYLHFYGEDQLVGIGMDTEEKTGITNGVKISMFDISDPTDVTEEHIFTIEDMYNADVFWDYKAVLVDYEKNMIGFSCTGSDETYYIFSYDEKDGFTIEMEEQVNGYSYLGTRGVYVGDRFYVIKGNAIESYRMGTFEKIDDLLL